MNQATPTPASQIEAKSALRALFESFPTAERGDAMAALGTYLIAIDGYSLKAIQSAVRKIVRGEVDDIDRRFLPTPAQFSNVIAYCEKLYAPVEKRIALPAPRDIPPTPEEQARRAVLAAKVRDRFGIQQTGTGETTTDRNALSDAQRAERERALESTIQRLKAGPLPMLSAEALAKCVPDPAEQFDNWNERAA